MAGISMGRLAAAAALAGFEGAPADDAVVAELGTDAAAALADGSADFVVGDGVLSAGPQAMQTALAEAARLLRDGGVAVFAYPAAPGALPSLLSRALGRRAAERQLASGDAAGAKAAVLSHLGLAAGSAPDGGLYKAAVSTQLALLQQRDPDALLRDELGPHWSPVAVADLAAQAQAHGLAYAGELLPGDRWRERTPSAVASEIERAAGPAASDQQQYVDDLVGAVAHESVFVKRAAPSAPAGAAGDAASDTAAPAGTPAVRAYDAVLYPSRPILECQPSRMAAVAALAGVAPPDLAGATVVDLGCGIATNLLSIAARRPDVTAIGVDPSGGQIDFAASLAADAGLTNASLVQDTRAPLDDGTADFVMAHGVMTWVDAGNRAAVVAEAARITRRGGLVLLSYNVSPGALYRTLTRSIGRRAARAAIEAGDPRAARDVLIGRLQAAAQSAGERSLHGLLAAEEAERVAQVEPGTLFHDELNDDWTPLAVSEVAALAARHGLAYVGELRPGDRWRARFAEPGVRNIIKHAGPSAVAQQQLVDDMLGSEFHLSLFVRGAAPKEPIGGGARRAAGPPAAQWHVANASGAAWPELPEADRSAVAAEISGAGAAGLSIGDLASRTGLAPDAVRAIASQFDAYGLARLELEPELLPAADQAGERPEASALARAELRSGQQRVSSLHHLDVDLDNALFRELVLLLDGTRDRAALADAMRALPHDGAAAFADGLDERLQALANAGVLRA